MLLLGLAAGLCAVLTAPAPAAALGEKGETVFGAGGILGEPTGGTMKLWFGPRLALQAHAAITWWGIHRIAFFVDFLWHPNVVTENKYFLLLWYFGVGGGVGILAPWDTYHHHTHVHPHTHDHDWEPYPAVWVRVPFGFPFLFDRVPVEAFVEFGPMLPVFEPDVDFHFQVFIAIGGRWYF